MNLPAYFTVGDRVRPSVAWPAIPQEPGTIVDVEPYGAGRIYTVQFDGGGSLRMLGFMLSRLDRPERDLTN